MASSYRAARYQRAPQVPQAAQREYLPITRCAHCHSRRRPAHIRYGLGFYSPDPEPHPL